MHLHGHGYRIPTANLQATRNRNSILNSLRRAVPTRRKIRVRGIANLDDARTGARPAGLGIAPQQFKVDDGLVWREIDEVAEYGRPFVHLHSGHLVHFGENFALVDGVVPVFGFGAGDLRGCVV